MQTLNVIPNPYTFVDHDGEAQGACPPDVEHSAGKRMWIGARLDNGRTKILKEKRAPGDYRPFDQVTKFVFDEGPIEIPMTPHYLVRIREGDLIAADERSYVKACGNKVGYLPPEQALAEARAKAFDNYVAGYAEPPAFTRAAVVAADDELGDATGAPGE